MNRRGEKKAGKSERLRPDLLDGDEKHFLHEWLIAGNKELSRKNKELLIENKKLQSKIKMLTEIRYIDAATGMHNKAYLLERLDEELSRARRTGESLSCLFIDLDNFKGINERHGHLIGDRILRDIGFIIKSFCRREDVSVRFGGDEFVVLMAKAGHRKARIVAERLQEKICGNPFNYGGTRITLAINIGISTLNKETIGNVKDPEELVSMADIAMYKARKDDKTCIRYLPCSVISPAEQWTPAP
jgi:two-component system cell cycle response regulator